MSRFPENQRKFGFVRPVVTDNASLPGQGTLLVCKRTHYTALKLIFTALREDGCLLDCFGSGINKSRKIK